MWLAVQPQSNPGAVPLLDSSELDRALGTLDDILGDDDTELFMIFNEYDNAHSETRSIFSLKALKSLFYQMASASIKSFHSI